MQWDILAAILLRATIQSLFGMGVLLFGTPILLVLGYDFITALTILPPISLTINLLQVSKDYRYNQWPFTGRSSLCPFPAWSVPLAGHDAQAQHRQHRWPFLDCRGTQEHLYAVQPIDRVAGSIRAHLFSP
jgi:hypothetical protein